MNKFKIWFGDSIRRQSNIVMNQFKLDKLSNPYNTETYMQKVLIEQMISKEPSLRPKTKEVLANPVFWSKAKTLQFLQDVSDRIEKLDPSDQILVNLEKNASIILKNNWKTHICEPLQNDLRKFRQYNGVFLRDLLRAIRNKKHHYRELPPEVLKSLGTLPDEFVCYFTSRFPKLILHVYEAMQCCSEEPMLDVYYHFKEHHF
ncbi:unnamed protein product [Brachionus calyciflorus]|uniref:KEN domain-containing protein n=1 Tax=Brachionus calyciflorus TaxID=104777 RepID=A0A813WT91_9BILA|nr:unnamed protein product [Brachionus calyciflorus]